MPDDPRPHDDTRPDLPHDDTPAVPGETVLVIGLDDRTRARTAFATLTRLADDGAVVLHAAALVHRDDDGRLTVDDRVGEVETASTLIESHPRFAGLLTALVAPIDALLLGNSLVALTGAIAEPTPDQRVLAALAGSVPNGAAAVIADVTESDPAAVDGPLAGLGATVTRRPRSEITSAEVVTTEDV